MANKIKHYNIDTLESKGALINIIIGERSNGKSYQVKHKRAVLKYYNGSDNHIFVKNQVVNNFIEKGSRFMLVRRYESDIKSDWVEQYFADVDIEKISGGAYNFVTLYKGKIHLANIVDGKVKRGEHIGYTASLLTEQRKAGASYLDVTDIIFEEFMARARKDTGGYIHNEPAKFMNLYSTIDRKRGTTRAWLLGNTITRVNPYLNDWGIFEIVINMKQGEIKEAFVSAGLDVTIKIAIEYCASTGVTSYAIGEHANMLNTGAWQYEKQPTLSLRNVTYHVYFKVIFFYKNFKFIGEFMKYNNDYLWFIKPYKGELKDNLITFSDVIKPSALYQRDIYNITIQDETLIKIGRTFREDKIFYANDMTGTEFKNAIDFIIKK